MTDSLSEHVAQRVVFLVHHDRGRMRNACILGDLNSAERTGRRHPSALTALSALFWTTIWQWTAPKMSNPRKQEQRGLTASPPVRG